MMSLGETARHSDAQDLPLLALPCMNGFIALSVFGSLAIISVVITEFEWKCGVVLDQPMIWRLYLQRCVVDAAAQKVLPKAWS